MKNCLGIINLSENDLEMGALCASRPVAMLPFAGRYRVIDFALSNMVNSGISGIGVYTGNKVRSVMDHLGSGGPWDLDRKINGLYTFTPTYSYDSIHQKPGDMSLFYRNNMFIEKAKQDYLFFCKSFIVSNINLRAAFDAFVDSGADIGVLYKKVNDPRNRYLGLDKIHLDENGNFESIGTNLGMDSVFNLSMEMYFMKKSVYFEVFNDAIEKGNVNYLKQAVLSHMGQLKVMAYPYEGDILAVNNIKNYLSANMATLNPEISDALFNKKRPIYTKVKDEPSTFYKSHAKVKNAFVANGCEIDGFVENSIIFRGVKIGKGSIVRNSIIMQKTEIGENAHLNYVILDKRLTIKSGVTLIGDPTSPFISGKDYTYSKEGR